MDKAPAHVYAALLDADTYYCSISTMYRFLREENEVRERRNQSRHPVYARPELLATGPNQVWSWDITKLRGPRKWQHYYLYVIMDIFSRYVVGWMIADQESAILAKILIGTTLRKQGIEPGQLIIHADRGASMRSKPVALLLSDLGVLKSHSRPHTSNDNPFSEAQFKTMKYQPNFPDRFGSRQDAEVFCLAFFDWYNQEHYHSGIAMLTPETVHHGRADQVLQNRAIVLTAAHKAHPERFVNKPPVPTPVPTDVWINRPIPKIETKMLT